MKPIYWIVPHEPLARGGGHLRYRGRSLQPLRAGASTTCREGRPAARAHDGARYGRALDRLPLLPRPAADRAFARHRLRLHARLRFATGGQIFLGEASGAGERPALRRALADELADDPPPADRRAAPSTCKRKEELYHGPSLDQGAGARPPPARRADPRRLDPPALAGGLRAPRAPRPEVSYGYSGHHGLTGILAAAGPGISFGRRARESRDHAAPGHDPAASWGSSSGGSTARRSTRSSPARATGRHVAAGPSPSSGEERRLLRGGGARHPRAAPRPRLRVADGDGTGAGAMIRRVSEVRHEERAPGRGPRGRGGPAQARDRAPSPTTPPSTAARASLLKSLAFLLVPLYAHFLTPAEFGVLELVLATLGARRRPHRPPGIARALLLRPGRLGCGDEQVMTTYFVLIESVYPAVLIGGPHAALAARSPTGSRARRPTRRSSSSRWSTST